MCNALAQIMQTYDWQLQVIEEGMESTAILATIVSLFAVLKYAANAIRRRYFLFPQDMFFQRRKGFRLNIVLNFAGILRCNPRVYSQLNQPGT